MADKEMVNSGMHVMHVLFRSPLPKERVSWPLKASVPEFGEMKCADVCCSRSYRLGCCKEPKSRA